jgi:hypothetical protein
MFVKERFKPPPQSRHEIKQHIDLSSSPTTINKLIPEQPRKFKYASGTT